MLAATNDDDATGKEGVKRQGTSWIKRQYSMISKKFKKTEEEVKEIVYEPE